MIPYVDFNSRFLHYIIYYFTKYPYNIQYITKCIAKLINLLFILCIIVRAHNSHADRILLLSFCRQTNFILCTYKFCFIAHNFSATAATEKKPRLHASRAPSVSQNSAIGASRAYLVGSSRE